MTRSSCRAQTCRMANYYNENTGFCIDKSTKKKIIFNVYRCSSVLTVNSAYFLKEFYDHVHV